MGYKPFSRDIRQVRVCRNKQKFIVALNLKQADEIEFVPNLSRFCGCFTYINDSQIPVNYRAVKYADDTSFYKTVYNPESASDATVIQATLEWSNENFMSLNAKKTEIKNLWLNYIVAAMTIFP